MTGMPRRRHGFTPASSPTPPSVPYTGPRPTIPPARKGDVLTVEFRVMGIPCLGLNGGPGVRHNWAFSFQVATQDQAETDRYWHAIIDHGGQASECGWCQDKWGISWQITPQVLIEAITDPDPEAARRAFEAMMQMDKIDIATIEAARRGE